MQVMFTANLVVVVSSSSHTMCKTVTTGSIPANIPDWA